MKKSSLSYVVVTPARNEEKYIGKTIESVIGQTVRPDRYVIVSDGSTDATDDIVSHYARQYPFIRLIRREPQNARNFGSKVYAIRDGVDSLSHLTYDFICIMDADITFGQACMQMILERQQACPEIGICGGLVWETDKGKWTPYKTAIDFSVSGAMQMFRRKCYETIGGYIPLELGGIEMVVETMARMHGWQVQTIEEIPVYHYKPMGRTGNSLLGARFKRGRMEYVNGYHPLFQFFRFFKHLNSSPILLDTVARTLGYIWSMLTQEKRAVRRDVISYMQEEQLTRLRRIIFK